jgi:hypothetical protein
MKARVGFGIKPTALIIALILLPLCEDPRAQRLKEVRIEVGGHTLTVELARTPEEREKGLMFRRSLGPEQGMLFIFQEPATHSFWMKNTFIPLDVGYFDAEGFLIEVHSMEPENEVKTYTSSEPALYALEVNQGWFREKGLKKFAKLKMDEF